MGANLIIVESPAKVKTIRKFLGNDYLVKASVGHIRDLPSKTLGVDEEKDFAPHYQIITGKEKVVEDLRAAAAKADRVFLAPDPDREGEAIAWHVADLIKDNNRNIQRIQFNEITARAVKEALEHPKPINANLFNAQQARRILDRLVGYKLSPLLWQKVKRGISAGRVQSVALRLIVEREKERRAFVPKEHWLIRVRLAAAELPEFTAELYKVNEKKANIASGEAALALEAGLAGGAFSAESVEIKERERTPAPPFITSSLQQAANQRLGYTAKRTMNIAQRLYEGLELGARGVTALITYMRTDSVRISEEAREAAGIFIRETWGPEFHPQNGRVFKSKGHSQDAHEAVRPVDVAITPEEVRDLVAPEQYQLYKLIWTRFVASQMAAARVQDTVVLARCRSALFRARGERVLFPGFYVLSPQRSDDAVELPPLSPGQPLTLVKLHKEQKFTQPPPRYTEASLVRELEEKGIGRPSTYASIIATLLDREYARLEEKHFIATDLGAVVCDLLTASFRDLMDVGFTAQMEESLDRVAEGSQDWVDLLRRFSEAFNPTLDRAAKTMDSVKGGLSAGLPCPDCGKETRIKFGKAGPFLACSGYPDCRFSSNFTRDEQGLVHLAERGKDPARVMGICPDCGAELILKHSRTGSRFVACSAWPACKHAEPFSTGVPCPRCSTGRLVEKSSKRGKIFYSCDQYPACDYALWDMPEPGPCPLCGFPLLCRKTLRGKTTVFCPEKKCRYRRDGSEAAEE
jgi:DNA topoisomerase-1